MGEGYHNNLYYNEDYQPARAMKDNFRVARKSFFKTKTDHLEFTLIKDKDTKVSYLQDMTSDLSGFGFLGIDAPFDLAMLSPNFNEWNAESGLDAGLVDLTLADHHVLIGDKLRAMTVDEAPKSKLDIKGLVPTKRQGD